MLNFWVAAYPLVGSWCMTKGSLLAVLDDEADLLATIRMNALSYLRIGSLGAFWFIGVFTSISFVGALAVANTADGTILGLQPSDSIWVALATNLPVVGACVCEFHPQFWRHAVGVLRGVVETAVRMLSHEQLVLR